MNWTGIFVKQHKIEITDIKTKWGVRNTYVGSKEYLCGELRTIFWLYSADLSKVHSYTVIASLLFHSIIDKVFSITHGPLTKLGALMNKTQTK